MDTQPAQPGAGRAKREISVLFLRVSILVQIFIFIFAIVMMPRITKMFDDYDTSLPDLSLAIMRLGPAGVAILAGAMSAAFGMLYWGMPDKRILISILFVSVSLVSLVVVMLGYFRPLIHLMTQMQSWT